MGICYSQQQQWEAYKKQRKDRNLKRRKQKNSSIIYEQKSIYQSSFASNIYTSFREELHNTISEIAGESGQMIMGSLTEMKEEDLDKLYSTLSKINPLGQLHEFDEPIILCNLKTKNNLHTHRIKIPQCKLYHEVSCCPYTQNHIIEYDIWKIISCEHQQLEAQEDKNQIQAYIYHPFTQRFLNYDKGCIVASEQKKKWRILSYGPRRNCGFIKIYCDEGELCMTESKALLQNHRKLDLCTEKHISHLWQINFVDLQEE